MEGTDRESVKLRVLIVEEKCHKKLTEVLVSEFLNRGHEVDFLPVNGDLSLHESSKCVDELLNEHYHAVIACDVVSAYFCDNLPIKNCQWWYLVTDEEPENLMNKSFFTYALSKDYYKIQFEDVSKTELFESYVERFVKLMEKSRIVRPVEVKENEL